MTDLNRRALLKSLAYGAVGAVMAQPLLAAGHAATHEIKIQGFAFVPGDLSITVGDKVVFSNADGAPHTATADDGSFDTGVLQGGDEATVTFDTAGTFEYFCAVHPHMRAKIIVTG